MPIAQAMYAAPTRQTVALVAVSHCHNRPQTHSRHLLPPHNFYRTQVRSLSFLVPQSEVLLLNFVQIAIFVNVVKIDTRISPWLLNGFLKIITWICQSCFMDLFKLLHGLVKVVICISRPLPNKTKLKFNRLLRLLL